MDKVVMSLPISKYKFSEITDDLGKVEIYVYHNGYNPNGSFFEDECLDNSKESFKNKPICCGLEFDNDGNVVDFKSHEADEKPIGVVPETNNYHIDEVESQKWAVVDSLIFKEYCGDEWELIKQGKKISMEIEVLDGNFDEGDGFYHIKKFNLLCITCLGDSYSPAMGENATIKTYTNIVSDTFISKFTEIINKANELGNGGNKMGREQIIAKFESIQNVEGYQAIIDNQELSNEELEKSLFSLSCNQIQGSLSEELSFRKCKKKRYWDGEEYETEQYWLEDVLFTDNKIIACDRVDYNYYALSFSLEGDKANIDYDSAERYVRGDWRKYEGGTVNNIIQIFTNEIIEKAQEEFENIKNSFNAKETEEYKTIETELGNLKAEYTTIQGEKVAYEEELATLRQFKLDADTKAKSNELDSILEQFSLLEGIKEFEDIRTNKLNYSKEELTKELKIIAFDNQKVVKPNTKFAKEVSPVQIPVEPKIEPTTDSYWESRYGNVEKYKNL